MGHRLFPFPLAASAPARDVLALRLGAAEYGIDVSHVLETRGWERPVPLSGGPAFNRGTIELRGRRVPMIDLRLRLKLPRADCDPSTPLIVVRQAGRTVGLLADGVADIVTLTAEQLLPVPDFTAGLAGLDIDGLGAIGERVLILIDLPRLLSGVVASSI